MTVWFEGVLRRCDAWSNKMCGMMAIGCIHTMVCKLRVPALRFRFRRYKYPRSYLAYEIMNGQSRAN